MNSQSMTDWDRIDALQDDEIDYSEIPDLRKNEAFWAQAEVGVPPEDKGGRDFSRPFEGVPWMEIGKYLINAVKAILFILPLVPTSIPLPSLSIRPEYYLSLP